MNEADSHIRSLMNNQQSIQQVANILVLKFPQLVYELSKVIERHFNQNTSDKKALCVALVCEILKKANLKDSSRKFVKGLAQRLKYFLHDLTRQYVSQGTALNISRSIESLKQTDSFCSAYFQKLQTLAVKYFFTQRRIKENSNSQVQNFFEKSQSCEQDQNKYKRGFLKTLTELNKNKSLRAIYDTYADLILFSRKSYGRQAKNIDNQNREQKSFNELRENNLEMNLQPTQFSKERLERILEECHSHILKLKTAMKEQVRQYEEILSLVDINQLEYKCSMVE